MIKLNTDLIFVRSGGPSGLLKLITKHKVASQPPSYSTIQMWQQRHKVSGDWIIAVLYALYLDNHEILDFFMDDGSI